MERIKNRLKSDSAASGTVEMIVIITLAVFAGLALFRFILRPVSDTADGLGGGIKNLMENIMGSDGKTDSEFEFKPTPDK